MKTIGIYRFYSNGKLLSESRNLLTTKGKQQVLRCMSGQLTQFAGALALGVGTTAATINDTSLDMEISRANISVVSPDMLNSLVIFKSSIPSSVTGIFKEAGLYSQYDNTYSGNYGSRLLIGFDSVAEAWPAGTTFNATNSLIGTDALRLVASTSSTVSSTLLGIYIDLLGYSNSDVFKIAYYVADTHCSTIKLRLSTDVANYYEYTISTPSVGYHVTSFNKTNFVTVGSPSWSTVASAGVYATATSAGSTTVDFDGVRIEDVDSLNPDYFLISRSVLTTPFSKVDSSPLDVEYSLAFTL